MKKPSISIVVPAFNEEESLPFVLKDTLKRMPKYFKNYEILIINDGSTDNTAKIAERFSKKNKHIKVIHQSNQGFSKAMLTGVKKASKDFVAYMPADGQFLTEDMRHCFELMNKGDIILGYRGGRQDYTIKRVFFSYGYLLLLLVLFDIKYMDVGWVHIWRTSKVKKVKFKALGGIFILTEVLVRFRRKGYIILEAPSYYHPRIGGEVKNAKTKVVASTFLNAIKLWLETKI